MNILPEVASFVSPGWSGFQTCR